MTRVSLAMRMYRLALDNEGGRAHRPAKYVAHLQRFTAWLEQRYQATLLEATTRDLRQYTTELVKRQKPASVNAALAALRRFFNWAADTERIVRNPAQRLTDIAAQPLAPKGFTDVERRRLARQPEKDGPMVDAIVTLLVNTGLRVDELVTLTRQHVEVRVRSGWINVVGKGDRRRRLPLNAEARKALETIRPTPAEYAAVDAAFLGKCGPYTARGIEYLVAELGRRANVPNVHPHRFRHDTARRLVESVDLPTVAAWLGHERLDTVRIYSQPDEAALSERQPHSRIASGPSAGMCGASASCGNRITGAFLRTYAVRISTMLQWSRGESAAIRSNA
jgi:site-specific recombinase XerD